MVDILVVEDFEPFRRTVTSMIEENPELRVVCEVSDGFHAVQKAEELQPDLVLMDIGLPKLNGIEAARTIRNAAPQSGILFLTQETSPHIIREAFDLGASGFIVKMDVDRDLLAGIDSVLQGKRFVSTSLRRNGVPRFADWLLATD
jgi:DNA-binding NarL/FixJ family response regulator